MIKPSDRTHLLLNLMKDGRSVSIADLAFALDIKPNAVHFQLKRFPQFFTLTKKGGGWHPAWYKLTEEGIKFKAVRHKVRHKVIEDRQLGLLEVFYKNTTPRCSTLEC